MLVDEDTVAAGPFSPALFDNERVEKDVDDATVSEVGKVGETDEEGA